MSALPWVLRASVLAGLPVPLFFEVAHAASLRSAPFGRSLGRAVLYFVSTLIAG
jgi:hypothetical protein